MLYLEERFSQNSARSFSDDSLICFPSRFSLISFKSFQFDYYVCSFADFVCSIRLDVKLEINGGSFDWCPIILSIHRSILYKSHLYH